jgi:amidase
MRSTSGAIELRDYVPEHDAPVVSSLRAAGAIIMGKTNLCAWCGRDTETKNDVFGTTNNPWDLTRTVGGSSGGSAAAVAAGLSSCDIGTDIGGSVRMPSHFCGVYGLKPSYGVVSQLGYLSHVGGGRIDVDMNHFGPIARSADDLELLLDAIAGADPEDAAAWHLVLPAARHVRLADYRIGTWFDEPDCPIASEYREILGRTADRLRAAGATVDDAHPNVSFREHADLWIELAGSATAPGLPAEIAKAAGGAHLRWLRNQERKQDLRQLWRAWFDDYDAVLCPVTLSAAQHQNHEGDMLDRTVDIDGAPRSMALEIPLWCALLNVIGVPSCVVPVGRTAAGLPVGVQIVTAYLRDHDSIDLARRMGDVIARYEPPPLAIRANDPSK